MNEPIELIHERYSNVLVNTRPGLPDGDYKILIPRGTHFWRLSVEPYKSPEPGHALLAFDAPPIAPGTPAGTDTRETLARAWAGETLAFHGEPLGSSLTISTPEDTSTFRADRDRWLFLHIDFPGPTTLNWQSRIVLHAEATPPPPAPTPPPDGAEAHTLALVQKAGLDTALMKFGACTSTRDLIDRAIGDGVWAGLLQLVRLAASPSPSGTTT